MEEYLNYKERRFLGFLFKKYNEDLQTEFTFQTEDLDYIGARNFFEFENLLKCMTIRGYIIVRCVNMDSSYNLAYITLTEKALNRFNQNKKI